MSTGREFEFEEIARRERESREALEAARDRNELDDGVSEHEHHQLIQKLEQEWQQAREHLERARGSSGTE